jgi:CDP-4-dehydro-6-deoxyglucose reductase
MSYAANSTSSCESSLRWPNFPDNNHLQVQSYMTTITLSSGKRFATAEGQTILIAANGAGVLLPYSCQTGRCGTCKARVLSGTTVAVNAETGLSEAEKLNGWILNCARSAETDLTLEVDELTSLTLPPVQTWPCRIKSLDRMSDDVMRVTLRLPASAEFKFIPGQYVDLIGPQGIRRSYSLANPDFADKTLELHIRAVKNGAMSRYWFDDARVNDLLRFQGPKGTFFLREVTDSNLIFLATGTGIAPIKAMLKSLTTLPSNLQAESITVLWGGRNSQDLYLDVSEVNESIHYIPVLSRPAENWSGSRGHVQDVLLRSKLDLTKASVYACGSQGMIESARIRLTEAGLPHRCFYSDAFVSSGTN